MAAEKLVKDGKVAVLVSPGFGAGWSTWVGEKDRERAVFDPVLAQALLDGMSPEGENFKALVERLYPEAYTGGASDLRVEWVGVGDRFRVHEYDGSESLEIIGPDYGYTA